MHDGPLPPTASVEDGRATLSLRRWARRWPIPVIAAWLALTAMVIVLIASRGVTISGDVEALLPVRDRSLVEEPLVLLTLRGEPGPERASTDTLLATAAAVADRLGPERVPLAPPAGEAAAWFDAHALFLVPDDALADLRARLSDEAMSAAVEELRARLSSPLFGVGVDEPRRDPLALRDTTADAAGRFGHIDALGQASATASGDLLDRHGTAVLVQLRSERPAEQLLADVVAAIGDAPVEAALVGPAGIEAAAREVVAARSVQVFAVALAGLALVLAAALRRVRATAIILACLASALAIVSLAQPVLDTWAVPLLVLLAGFSCEGALHLPRISARGWAAPFVLATALVPLAIDGYPAWERWAWLWALGIAVSVLLMRVVVPAMYARFGGEAPWEGRGSRWRPMPVTAVLLGVTILGGGAWASANVRYRGGDRIALTSATLAQTRLLDDFFDPALVVHANTSGTTPAEALEHTARDAAELAKLVPIAASGVDSPGSLVVSTDDIARRRVALSELKLPVRMLRLREILESRGFRADAFGEFLRTARVDEAGPTAAALLDGPLGSWLRRYQASTEPATFRSFVHLDADDEAELPRVLDGEGRPIHLYGPAVAARRDRAAFHQWLAIWTLCQIWLGAFFVWVGTRSFSIAVSAAVATLVTVCATLVAMAALRLPVGPVVVPGILLVGAAATIAAGRACRAVDLGRPLFATGLLVTSLCQAAAAMALIVSDVPPWRQLGLVVAIGAAIASGVGLFVAPGLCRALRRFGRGTPEPVANGGDE